MRLLQTFVAEKQASGDTIRIPRAAMMNFPLPIGRRFLSFLLFEYEYFGVSLVFETYIVLFSKHLDDQTIGFRRMCKLFEMGNVVPSFQLGITSHCFPLELLSVFIRFSYFPFSSFFTQILLVVLLFVCVQRPFALRVIPHAVLRLASSLEGEERRSKDSGGFSQSESGVKRSLYPEVHEQQ